MKKINNFNEFLMNESKRIDYDKKFGKKVEEINKLIDQAKKDDIIAIETDSTVESEYQFDKVELTKTMLKVYYKEGIPCKKKIEKISLAKDKENDFDETKYMFSWIKKCIKKGYREEGKEINMNESKKTFHNNIELEKIEIEQDHGAKFNWIVELTDKDYEGTIEIPKDERGKVEFEWNSSGKLPDYWEELEQYIENETWDYIAKNNIKLSQK